MKSSLKFCLMVTFFALTNTLVFCAKKDQSKNQPTNQQAQHNQQKVQQNKNQENDIIGICAICQDELKKPDNNFISLSCHEKHCFHIECIKRWAQGDRSARNTCPVCRKKYDEYEQLRGNGNQVNRQEIDHIDRFDRELPIEDNENNWMEHFFDTLLEEARARQEVARREQRQRVQQNQILQQVPRVQVRQATQIQARHAQQQNVVGTPLSMPTNRVNRAIRSVLRFIQSALEGIIEGLREV